jgi:hypothetical protein
MAALAESTFYVCRLTCDIRGRNLNLAAATQREALTTQVRLALRFKLVQKLPRHLENPCLPAHGATSFTLS